MSSTYLTRYAWKDRLFTDDTFFGSPAIVIVIPCFKEPDITFALDSLNGCDQTKANVVIIVVVNESETASEDEQQVNSASIHALESYSSRIPIFYKHVKLPSKKAGVGLARKIGMDEAVRLFELQGTDGIIACYDADCSCEPNYLLELEKYFLDGNFFAGVVFHEHVLRGENHEAIINYELFLRYYVDAIRFTGFPHAHQTLGSCIVVRSSTYQAVGGMNTRKAGEDFYFLNKVVSRPGFTELNNTTVYPSDRSSDRVPFGTGKAIASINESDAEYSVYNPLTFELLKAFFEGIRDYWDHNYESIPPTFLDFDKSIAETIREIRNQTSSMEAFQKRFFAWFDPFMVMKFAHFSRDKYHPNVPILEALNWLGQKSKPLIGSNEEKLIELRRRNRIWTKSDQTSS